jgi:Zn-dependent metalloprotease
VGLATFVLVGALGAPVAAQSRSGPDPELLSRLGGRTRVGLNAETRTVGYLGGTANRPVATSVSLGRPATARGAARAFVGRFGSLFGVASPARELSMASVTPGGRGRTFVRYQQTYRGVPVLAGELIVQTDAQRDVVSVGGEASPDLSVDVTPSIGAARARRLAVEATARREQVRARSLRAGRARLAIYDPRLTGDPTAMPVARLIWRVDVRSNQREINEFVAVDAHHGVIAAIFNQTPHADPPANARQRLCNASNAFATGGEGLTDPNVCDAGDPRLVAAPSSSSIADVLAAFRGAEATYDFFARRFGRDSIDDAGMRMISTVRFCHVGGLDGCPYHNAFWNGAQMVYGAGFPKGDDVIGHELTHGVTEFSSGLLYFYQSGAINEAMSDIFGEFVDVTTPGLGNDAPGARWLIGEDIPIGVLRNMRNPPAFGHPDRMVSALFTEDAQYLDQGGVHTNSGVANKAAFLMTDGGHFNGQTVTGLGIDKSAAIWYRVNNSLLSSGASYRDLGYAIRQACLDLVGSTPRNSTGGPSAKGPISAADCAEVSQAVAATEMLSDAPVANVKQAPLCGPGKTATVTPFNDTIGTSLGATGWTRSSPLWRVIDDYATSNPYAILGRNQSVASNTWVRSPRIRVPGNGFLSFRHYLDLEAGPGATLFDGGIVEYATNVGGPWKDLRHRFVFNGYNGTVSDQWGNPLGGRAAFGGFNYGWARSIASLSHLAGRQIYLRFRIGTDDSTALEGWAIDDVRVYRCVTPDTVGPNVGKPRLDIATTNVERDGTPLPVRVTFTASDPSGVGATSLQHRLGGGSAENVELPGRRSTAVITTVPDTPTAQTFRAGARDTLDNVSSNSRTARIRSIQETGGIPAVVYTGWWQTQSAATFYGGAARFASAAGRRARLTVANVTDLAWVATRGPNRGRAEVWVDGRKRATVDLYAPEAQPRRVVYAISFASPGSHRIEVRVLGTRRPSSSGTRVDLDAFVGIGS